MAATSKTSSLSNTELVRQAFDALNRQDLDFIAQFWTPTTVERFPDRTCQGSDEIRRYFEDTQLAIPDWHIEIQTVACEGEHVFVHWHLTGTHQGTLLGVAATGKALSIDGIDHFVIRDGKVVSNFVVFDQMQFARQIGMLPPDGSTADRALKAVFGVRTKVARALTRS